MARAGKLLLYVLGILASVLLIVEVALRLITPGVPTIPFYYQENGVPGLYRNDNVLVSFPDRPAINYKTNRIGARIADSANPDVVLKSGTFVIGDSQALGYGLAFEDTFAAQATNQLYGDSPVQLLASPSTDMELLSHGVCTEPMMKEMTPDLQILMANLGNDLDEMYLGGRTQRGIASIPMHKTLLRNSRIYMRLTIAQSRQALATHVLPGVNPVLYNLTPGERVTLADEMVARIKTALACAPDAPARILVLMPSDFQVNPDELLKYRTFSSNPAVFDDWANRRTELARMMDVLERYITARLANEAVTVLSFRQIAQDYMAKNQSVQSSDIFEPSSHHITKLGHDMLAAAITRSQKGASQ